MFRETSTPPEPVADAQEATTVAHLRKLTRSRTLLVECNRALVRSTSEQQLFEAVCQILAGPGGYSVAWIGIVEHDAASTIRPVAQVNAMGLDFSMARYSWADNEFGRGPAGRAVRMGAPQLARNAGADPNFAVWRSRATKLETQAAVAFPVRVDAGTVAVFALSSTQDGAFDSDEMALLAGLAEDIGFWIAALRARQAQRLAEQALAEGEQRFRAIFDLTAIGITLIDADGRILLANPFFERLLGYGPGELNGRDIRELRLSEDAQSVEEFRALRRKLYAGQVERLTQELRYRRKDGSIVDVEVSITLVRDAAGAPLYDLCAVADISERKNAEATLRESESRYRALTELSADHYWEQDENHRITRIGSYSAAPDVRQRTDPNLGKTRWEMGFVNMSAEHWAAHRARLDAREPFRDLLLKRVLKDTGEAVWLSLSGYPAYDPSGRFTGYHGIARNVTLRMRGEALLKMEHEVARVLAESDSALLSVRRVMNVMCETLDWICGRYFQVQPDGATMRLAEHWGRDEPEVSRYIEQSSELVFTPGKGLSGRAWQTREPVWSIDKSADSRLMRPDMPLMGNIRAGFVFPVISEGQVLGVISLSSHAIRDPDERLLQAVRVIGNQIGQFLGRKKAEEELRVSNERFDLAVRATNDAIWDMNLLTGELWWNENFFAMLGYAPGEVQPTDELWRRHIHPDDVGPLMQTFAQRFESGGTTYSHEYRMLAKDGNCRVVFNRSHITRDAARKAVRVIGAISDITVRKAAEERIRIQDHRQRLIANFAQRTLASNELVGVLRQAVDLVVEILEVDFAAIMRADYELKRLTCIAGHGWAEDWPGYAGIAMHPGGPTESVMARKEPLIVEDFSTDPRAAMGTLSRWGTCSGMLMPIGGTAGGFGVFGVHTRERRRFSEDDAGFLQSVSNILAVVIERTNAQNRLTYLAQFDSLTGLPNRQLFQDRLVQSIAHAKRTGTTMAVLFIDLDRFKLVNDTLGHAAGDKLLKEAAGRLSACVRSSDTVGRLGGDEFAATLLDLQNPDDAGQVGKKITDALARPFGLDGQEAYVSASVGITLYPSDSEDAATLITNADAAMYRAKEQGRNNYQYFTREMNERALRRAAMETQLRRALERNEFIVHYQPKVRRSSGTICGFEALLRWNHPERGVVSPLEFIPVLEDTGLIVPVGEWVLRAACLQIRSWREAGLPAPPVAVNLSARQFQQKDLEASVSRILRETGVDASLIEFEITESLLMNDPDNAARTLSSLSASGVKLAVDDFGTGYSSLSYLKRFPLDALKIDRSFVRDITTDADDAAITLVIINLAHTLGLEVIAEGVETRAQLDFLTANGCDEMQGFYFSRPVPADECASMMTEGQGLEPAANAHA